MTDIRLSLHCHYTDKQAERCVTDECMAFDCEAPPTETVLFRVGGLRYHSHLCRSCAAQT